ncbi:MAG: permease-like cell division protein FtsX [Fusicatenibacter sp.]|nr:permease-like cell division protein FtsX [Lachnospiraceae bacterium]MDY2937440.1 permease-like cell division protein FtsX [Fusicatenibacter sp.]
MRFSTLCYSIKQGVRNIWRNKMFSLASIATMGACIFLFGIFFAIVINFNYIVKSAETDVSMTVFFDEDADQATIDEIGTEISAKKEIVKEVKYVSADETWENFAKDYFEGKEEYKEGFRPNDNPLATSAHYEVYVYEVENQDALADYIRTLDGVRDVKQMEGATATLSTMNRVIAYVSIAIILILLAVSVFLISNTVTIGISVRKEEIGIMKLIGATNLFVRAPFLIEGILIGLIGAAIPLGLLYLIYNKVISYVMTEFSVLSSFLAFMPVESVFRILLPVGLLLGMGIGLVGSLVTIRKHLRV